MTMSDDLDRLEAAGSALRSMSIEERVDALGSVGERFLDPDDPLRREAAAGLPEESGFSPPMARYVLEHMAADWTSERLDRLVRSDFPDPSVLDRFADVEGRSVRVRPPALTAQFVGGAVPGVGVNALIRGLLVGSPTLLRPGAGDVLLPSLFRRGLSEGDSRLADACAVRRWPGDDVEATDRVLSRADTVVAYGSDAVVAELRARCPVTTRFVAYHHRTGVAVVTRGAIREEHVRTTATDLARAVAIFDQRGCVCPAVAFVECVDSRAIASLAAETARALDETASDWPPGEAGVAAAGALAQLSGTWELLHAAGSIEMFTAATPGAGRVIVDRGGSVDPPGLGRTIVVRPLPDLTELGAALEPFRGHLQSVGLAAPEGLPDHARDTIVRAGASRLVSIPEMAFPPPWWLHDGRGPLTELVSWVEGSRREF